MLLRRKRVLAAKIEGTPGTAESLSASDAAFNVFNATMQPTITQEEREGQSAFSPLPSIPGALSGTCTFSIELTGGGSTPAWASTFLPACGLVESSGTFTPKSEGPGSNVKTLTIGLYENGLVKKLRGAMGNAVFIFISGQRIMVEFTFTGIWVPPTDATILAPTYPTATPLRFVSADLTLGSYTPVMRELRLDLGNVVTLREDANDPSGYVSAIITGRKMVGTMDPESKLVATEDSYGKWLNLTERAMSINVGSTGNMVDFDAPRLQFTNLQEGDRNGIQVDTISYQLNRSAAGGDDELTIAM
jgi:hypothetical protein